MGYVKMKIGLLTSSRADFGIYYPLLRELCNDSFFSVEIIAFGTHLDHSHGYTIDEIKAFGFDVAHQIKTLIKNDEAGDISFSIGDCIQKFSLFWERNKFDAVFALGDRYEMFAAVAASTPFNIDILHIHAGETTLGAIDNAYRHSITLMSKYQFVSTDIYLKRVVELTQNHKNVYNVGGLSIDNLVNQKLLTHEEFERKFEIDLTIPTILSTFHPETVALKKNEEYISELLSAFEDLRKKYQIVITLPNSDTMGDIVRKKILEYSSSCKNVITVESFGMQGYLSIMKHCAFMIGNTSSGFGEAAFFPTNVINIGDRQKGRIQTKNIISVPVEKKKILEAVEQIRQEGDLADVNIYGDGKAAQKISNKIKELYGLH
jgi:GDP/UDP-N,N'-diacetylbacillosamine 2-epimerase (hydrolysing)